MIGLDKPTKIIFHEEYFVLSHRQTNEVCWNLHDFAGFSLLEAAFCLLYVY